MKQKKQKPMYLRIRLPQIRQIGGVHRSAKGGKHRRNREKDKTRQEVKAELE